MKLDKISSFVRKSDRKDTLSKTIGIGHMNGIMVSISRAQGRYTKTDPSGGESDDLPDAEGYYSDYITDPSVDMTCGVLRGMFFANDKISVKLRDEKGVRQLVSYIPLSVFEDMTQIERGACRYSLAASSAKGVKWYNSSCVYIPLGDIQLSASTEIEIEYHNAKRKAGFCVDQNGKITDDEYWGGEQTVNIHLVDDVVTTSHMLQYVKSSEEEVRLNNVQDLFMFNTKPSELVGVATTSDTTGRKLDDRSIRLEFGNSRSVLDDVEGFYNATRMFSNCETTEDFDLLHLFRNETAIPRSIYVRHEVKGAYLLSRRVIYDEKQVKDGYQSQIDEIKEQMKEYRKSDPKSAEVVEKVIESKTAVE